MLVELSVVEQRYQAVLAVIDLPAMGRSFVDAGTEVAHL